MTKATRKSAKPTGSASAPVVFFHIVWLDKYQGAEPGMYAGGFKWPKANNQAGEIHNFKNVNGKHYGYVEVHDREINGVKTEISIVLEKLGADKEAESVDGVTVIWTAPVPGQKGSAVVGWYKNATIYRYRQKSKGAVKQSRGGSPYRVIADAKDCRLLSEDERTLFIPSRSMHKKADLPGQSPVYYPANHLTPEAKHLYKRVMRFVETGASNAEARPSVPKRGGGGRQQDPEMRRKVEKAAIDHVKRHFRQKGFRVKSHEKDNCGYDLRAVKGDLALCIEVKGCSGADISAELTVHEYSRLCDFTKNAFQEGIYRICIVTSALSQAARRLHHYKYLGTEEGGNQVWSEVGNRSLLKFKILHAARITG